MSVHFFLSKSLAATVPNVPLRWSFAPSASFSFGFKPTIVVIPAFIFLVNSVSLVCESSFNISGVCSSFSLPTDEKHNFSNYLFLLSRVWQRSRFDYLLSFSCLGLQVLLDLSLSVPHSGLSDLLGILLPNTFRLFMFWSFTRVLVFVSPSIILPYGLCV